MVTTGVDRIEPESVRLVDGELRELDILVFATGFRVNNFIRPTTVRGKDGIDLSEAWADYLIAYMSISVPRFPNFFLLNGPNIPIENFSLIQIAEQQVAYVIQLIDQIDTGSCREICASQTATDAFEIARKEAAKQSIFATGCQSWYLDKNGVPTTWPWSPDRFYEEMQRPNLQCYYQTT